MKSSIYDLVDVRFHRYIDFDDIGKSRVKMIRARDMINHKRVDIIVKIKYLEALISQDAYDLSYFESLYIETISLFTDGNFVEPGNAEKNSKEKFIQTFKNVYKSILEFGFNYEQGIVPISESGVPLDGAHRLAVAYLLDLEVPTITLRNIHCDYGLSFFAARSSNDILLSRLVLLLADFEKKLRVAIFWPCANVTAEDIDENFKNSYIFKKELELNENGVNNLCLTAYEDEKWIGSPENCWSGVWNKSRECHTIGYKTIIVLYESSGINDDLLLKKKFREAKGKGKHSIHSTDSIQEAQKIINTIFVPYSDKYLNNINLRGLKKVVAFLDKEKIDVKSVIITGSSVLDFFNIRHSNDVDFIYKETEKYDANIYKMSHNAYQDYFSSPVNKLFLYNEFTFYFFNIHFLAIDELSYFKKMRNESKDNDDLVLIKEFISDTVSYKNKFIKIKRNVIIRYNALARIFKRNAIELLKITRSYELARKILRMRRK
ncbi:TPA: hypothetical protein ACSTJX_003648 [Serratia fonticola]